MAKMVVVIHVRGRCFNNCSLKEWIDFKWPKILCDAPISYILPRGWFFIIFKSSKDEKHIKKFVYV